MRRPPKSFLIPGSSTDSEQAPSLHRVIPPLLKAILLVSSTFASNTPRTYPTSSKSIEIGVDGQPVVSYPTTPDYENGVEEEIAVEETTPYEVIGPETSTHPNTVVDKAEVEFSGESVRGNPQPTRNRDSSGATTLTWIIAISAIVGKNILCSPMISSIPPFNPISHSFY